MRQSEIIEHQVRSAAQPAAAEGPPGIRPQAGSVVNQDGNWPAFWNPETRLWGSIDSATSDVEKAQSRARLVAHQHAVMCQAHFESRKDKAD